MTLSKFLWAMGLKWDCYLEGLHWWWQNCNCRCSK